MLHPKYEVNLSFMANSKSAYRETPVLRVGNMFREAVINVTALCTGAHGCQDVSGWWLPSN